MEKGKEEMASGAVMQCIDGKLKVEKGDKKVIHL